MGGRDDGWPRRWVDRRWAAGTVGGDAPVDIQGLAAVSSAAPTRSSAPPFPSRRYRQAANRSIHPCGAFGDQGAERARRFAVERGRGRLAVVRYRDGLDG